MGNRNHTWRSDLLHNLPELTGRPSQGALMPRFAMGVRGWLPGRAVSGLAGVLDGVRPPAIVAGGLACRRHARADPDPAVVHTAAIFSPVTRSGHPRSGGR